MLPYAAYLRVYEPLNAFTPSERSSWAAYARATDRPRRASALQVEHREAVRRLLGVPPAPAPLQESPNAYLRRVEEVLYVCPWQSRLRSWLAFSRFRGATPARLMERFIPISVAERTADEFDRFKRRGGAAALRTHIRTSTWHVPAAWFVPFDGGERWLTLGGEQGPSGRIAMRNLLYITSMAHARRRTARALQIIRRHIGDIAITTEVEEVARWLEEFHPHSLLELDYGGLVHLMEDDKLLADQSAAEISAALTGLENGEEELAFAMYRRVILRWRSIQLLESAN